MDTTVVWTAVGAVGSIAAAGVAAGAAWLSRASAQEANAAAKVLAAIEQDRRHKELEPQFDITCRVLKGPGPPDSGDSGTLRITLTGDRLEKLDEVTVTILDDAENRWDEGLPPGVTEQEAQAFVWGGLEFDDRDTSKVVSNRQSRPRAYSQVSGKNRDVLPMRPTRPGPWMENVEEKDWLGRWTDHPVRLLLTCRREGQEPWLIPKDVEVTVATRRTFGSPQSPIPPSPGPSGVAGTP